MSLCGTPDWTLTNAEWALLTTAACLLLFRKSEIHLLISPWMPYWLSLWIKRLWLTLLKALAKSTMRMSVCCPCARFFFFFPKMPTIMLMIIPFSISSSANLRNCVLKDLFFRNSCCWLHSMLFRSRWSMVVKSGCAPAPRSIHWWATLVGSWQVIVFLFFWILVLHVHLSSPLVTSQCLLMTGIWASGWELPPLLVLSRHEGWCCLGQLLCPGWGCRAVFSHLVHGWSCQL